jgi:NADH:ubiquinone oxidoreductase subunit 5 (subunit L)/multisubunit Na+/H+ antiporter MnhA subunit
MDIDHLGGVGKAMKHTSALFLVAAIAICGLPPLNGFISEYLIYNGLFHGLKEASLSYIVLLAFSILGLALIGGLAMLCFTKAFGSVFLGSPRFEKYIPKPELFSYRHAPMYLITLMIVAIGIFPGFFFNLLTQPVSLFTAGIGNNVPLIKPETITIITKVGYASAGFILLTALIYFIRFGIGKNRLAGKSPTWGCGYIGPNEKLQYTASSFIRNYRKLAEPLLLTEQHKKDVKGIFPGKAWHETHPKDKMEEYIINSPLRKLRNLLGKVTFLQNGRPQVYILYGAVFIMLIISVPPIIDLLKTLVEFLKTM